MSVTRTQLGVLVAVFVGGAASGVVGWSWSRGDDAPRDKRAGERTEESLRGVDREELKRALVELGFRLDESELEVPWKDVVEAATHEPREVDGSVVENEGVEGTPVSEVLAALERSYLDQMEREKAASSAQPAEVDAVAALVPEAVMEEEAAPAARVAMAELPAQQMASEATGANGPVFQGPTHVGDVVQNTVVQNNTVQQVQVFQPIFFNPGFNPGLVGAPAPQRRVPSSSRNNDVFRPVDLNAHYANPFSSPPPWIAR